MASTSGKNMLCFIHIGGTFVSSEIDGILYVGGMVRSRVIKEGTSYEELKTIVALKVGKFNNNFLMKFTLTLDRSTFVDLVDDEGVEHLIKFNGDSRHLYVEDDEDDSTSKVMEDPQQELLLDNISEGWEANIDMIFNEDPPSLDGAMQMMPTSRPEIKCTKWKDVIIGEGQVFANAGALRETLYKYSIAHKFSYKYVKNNKQKIIVKCGVEGCPWYLGAYSMGERQDTEFLTIQTLKDKHQHGAQDDLIVAHAKISSLTSSVMVDTLRDNIEKSSNDIRREMYRDYGLRLSYSQAYRGKAKALRKILGREEDSYMAIPWICERLVETDPDSIARCEFSSSNRFERVFISYGCSMKGFLEGCHGILYIDGCHLSGPYKGTLISANAFNADDHLFSLAYAIVSGETHDEWT